MSAQLKFDEARHEYSVNGRVVPNVTRIIDWMNNYANVPREALELARARGQAVHLATALDDQNDLDESSVDDVVLPYLNAWRQFREECKFKPILIEHRIYSSIYNYAGSLDRTGLLGTIEQPALVDVKATACLMPANGPQTAAYKQGLIEQGHDDASLMLRATVRLCPEQSPPYRIDTHRSTDDLSVFISSINLYNWRLKHGYKNNDAR